MVKLPWLCFLPSKKRGSGSTCSREREAWHPKAMPRQNIIGVNLIPVAQKPPNDLNCRTSLLSLAPSIACFGGLESSRNHQFQQRIFRDHFTTTRLLELRQEMVGSILWKRYRFVLLTTLIFGATSLINQPVQANGGSWGSSGGGFSSGGSWGSGGLLGGRRPVRNLLSRIGGRLGNASAGSTGSMGSGGSLGSGGSGGSLGSRGGLFRGGRLGGGLLRRRANGSSGGWSGSTGGWTASHGSTGTGSTGYGSSGYVSTTSGSTGTSFASSGSYAGSSSGASYGEWGASYLNSFNAPIETSYTMPGHSMGGFAVEQSYPVGDYGFANGIPVQNGMPMNSMMGVPTNQGFGGAIMDGGSIGPMLDGGMPIEGFTPAGEGYYDTPVDPNGSVTLRFQWGQMTSTTKLRFSKTQSKDWLILPCPSILPY